MFLSTVHRVSELSRSECGSLFGFPTRHDWQCQHASVWKAAQLQLYQYDSDFTLEHTAGGKGLTHKYEQWFG